MARELLQACTVGDMDKATLLINKGANIDVTDEVGKYQLIYFQTDQMTCLNIRMA